LLIAIRATGGQGVDLIEEDNAGCQLASLMENTLELTLSVTVKATETISRFSNNHVANIAQFLGKPANGCCLASTGIAGQQSSPSWCPFGSG
jgi:hypothetical protein